MARKSLNLSCVFVLAVLVFGASVGSAASMGPLLQITIQDFDKTLPDVAYNSVQDEFLVVWVSTEPGHSATIMGQRRTGSGAFISEFIIAREDNPAHDNTMPSAAYDPVNERYLVVWTHDSLGDGQFFNVYGRLVPWNGPTASLSAFSINNFASISWRPRVAYGGGTPQGFMVSWRNQWSGGSPPNNIYAQRLDTAGTLQGGPIEVAVHASEHRIEPDIAYNRARNEYLIVYSNMVGEISDVYGVRLSAIGEVITGAGFGIAGWPDHEFGPRVAASRVSNCWAVVWQSMALVLPRETNVFASLVWVDGTGTVQLAPPVSVSPLTVDEFFPDVAAYPESSNFLIAWGQQYNSPNNDIGIWARVLHSTNRLGTFYKPRTPLAGETIVSKYPAVAAGKHDWLVAWQHTRDGSTTYQDIYGRVLYSRLFADGFQSGFTTQWSSSTQ